MSLPSASQAAPRTIDLILFGSTGFVGRLAAEYFAQCLPTKTRWAIAGRDQSKLDAIHEKVRHLPTPPSKSIVVDHLDAAAISHWVKQARVVINYAGPFIRTGENIVAACAEHGTHYLDITGETVWIRRMIEKYTAKAQRSGAILIPFAGFDSVPSDLGAWKVSTLAQQTNPSQPITQVVNLLSMRGGINGGTYETLLDILAFNEEDQARLHDPALLVPDDVRGRFQFSELKQPFYIPEEKLTAPPFFMEPINSRVVYRSQGLAAESSTSAKPFEYIELIRIPRFGSKLQAWGWVTGGAVFNWVGRKPWGLGLLKKFGVRSGQGPSEKVRASGFFRAEFFAYSGKKLAARLKMFYPGDPGNRATVLLSAEATLCFLQNENEIPAKTGGFWTPSTALGPVLYRRLEKAGVQFKEN